MDRLYELLIEDYKEKFNKKVDRNESLKSILEEKNKDELLRLILLFQYSKNDNSFDIIEYERKSKNVLIDFIINNINDCVKNLLIKSNEDIFKQLRVLTKNNGYDVFTLNNFNNTYNYSFRFLEYINSLYFGKIYFNSELNELELYIPKEIVEILNKEFNSKTVIKENKKYNKLVEFIHGVVDTFGILEADELYVLIQHYNITDDSNKMINTLFLLKLLDDGIEVYYNGKYFFVYNVEFEDEEEAINYYKKIKKFSINMNLSYKDIINIGSTKYITKLNEYNELISYLKDNYDIDDNDIEEIKLNLIDDYFYSRKLDKKRAESNFRNNVKDFFETDPIIENIILNKLEKIYEKFPKWDKRGNI